MTFIDPAHQRLLAFGFARQGLLEHFNDIAKTSASLAPVLSNAPASPVSPQKSRLDTALLRARRSFKPVERIGLLIFGRPYLLPAGRNGD